MKRAAVVPFALLFIVFAASVARADHVPTNLVIPEPLPVTPPVLSQGPVRHITNVQAGKSPAAPLGEHGPFERNGRKYFAASSLMYGFEIVDVTDPLAPFVVSSYASTFGCPTVTMEAAAAGNPDPFAPLGGWENDQSVTPDGRFVVLGTDGLISDGHGRCHDPHGMAMELVDITDLENPRTLHLTRNVGDAHSITIDPKRPWLVYLSTSDGADFIDIIDIKSCFGGVAKLDKCKPVVARIPFTKRHWKNVPMQADGEIDVATRGCHDIRFQGDFLYCAAVGQTSIIDVSGVLDAKGRLTGTHLTSGANACPVVPATRAGSAMVTDCSGWSEQLFEESKAKGANAELLSIIVHDRSKPPAQDINISHQAEATADGRIMFVTDERGGGLSNSQGCPGGGVHFYDIRDKRRPVMMKQPDGSPGVYLTKVNLPGTAHMSCTVHYGEQFGSENVMVFAWYLNGIRMMRYDVDWTTSPPTVTFTEVGAYLPLGAESIQAKPILRNPANPDEIIIYAADLNRGLDVLGLTLPKIKLPKPVIKPKVLGTKRTLPVTGVGDPVTVGLMLLIIGTFVVRRLRAVV